MTKHVQLIRSDKLTDQVDYAYAARVSIPSPWIFSAGACPLDADGNTVAIGDYAGQAVTVMRNLATALEEAGAALTDVVKTTVYVASSNQDDLVAAWDVVHAHFGDHDAPSTLVGVTVLGYDDQLVEVEAVAVLST